MTVRLAKLLHLGLALILCLAQFVLPAAPTHAAVDPSTAPRAETQRAAPTLTLAGPADARLTRFRFDTSTPGRVWATYQQGATRAGDGMLFSDDFGQNWTVHTSPQRFVNRGYTIGVHYYEVDPTNANVRYSDGLKSLDGGQNWLRADSVEGGGAVDAREFAISPANPQVLYARNGNSLYRSSNGGASWARISAPPSVNNGSILAGMRLDPAHADTLYTFSWGDWGPTSCHSRENGVHCLSVSRDGGATWTDIQPTVVQNPNGTPQKALPLDLAVVPAAGGQPSLLFAAARGDYYWDNGVRKPMGGVLRSVDGGATWQRLPDLPLDAGVYGDGQPVFVDYQRIVAAQPVKDAPADTQTLYAVAGNPTARPNGAMDAYANRLFRSKDGGASWQAVQPAAVDSRFYQQIVDVAVGAGGSVDGAHVVVAAVQKTLVNDTVVAFASGSYHSADNGATWAEVTSPLSNMGFDWVKTGPGGLWAFVGGLGLLTSADDGATWAIRSPYLMDNGVVLNSLVFDPADSNVIFAGTSGSARGILRSADGGVTWEGRNLGIGAVDARMLAILSTSPQTLFAAAGSGLVRSTDGGASWYPIGGSPALYTIHPNPTNPQILYGQGYGQYGGDTSHLWRSLDGGNTWADLANNADVFALDPNDPQRIYKSASPTSAANAAYEGIDLSVDGGATWATMEPGEYGNGRRLLGLLPTDPAILLSVRRQFSGRTPQPAFMDYSNDGGQTWIALGNATTTAPIIPGAVTGQAASFFTRGGVFTLGTAPCDICGADVLVQDSYGGLWQYTFDPLPQAPPPPPLVDFSAAAYRVAENAGSATITVTLDAAPVGEVQVDYNTASGTAYGYNDYTDVSGTLTFGPGETTKTFQVPITADNEAEADETVQLTLSNPRRAGLGSVTDAVLTIVDGGPPPAARLSAATFTAYEASGRLEIEVVLDKAPTADVYVGVLTEDESTTAGQDYYLDNYGSLTIPAGHSRGVIGLSIYADGVEELEESFILRLSDVNGVTLGSPSSARITIVDERMGAGPSLFLPNVQGGAGGGSAPVAVPTAAPNEWPSVQVTARNLPANTAAVKVQITGVNVMGEVTQQAVIGGGVAQATLAVPPGPPRLVRATATDAGGATVGEIAQLVGVEAGAGTTIALDLAFGAPLSVNCANVAASVNEAPPGKLIRLNGLALPPTAQLGLLAADMPAGVVNEDGVAVFALPVGLPPGSVVPLTMLVDGRPLPCALPSVKVLSLPPAPGESQRVVREVAALVADLVALAPPAEDGTLPQEAVALGKLKEAILQQVANLPETAQIPADALLAQSGLLTQIQSLRGDLAAAATASSVQTRAGRASWLAARDFTSARDMLIHQEYLASLRANSVDNPTYKVIKTTVNVYLVTLGIAMVAISAANPALVIAEIAAASQIITIVSLVWYVVEKVIDLTTRGVYSVTAVHAEIPSPAMLLVGEARPWNAGTIDTRRDQIELKASEIVEYVLVVVGGFGGIFGALPQSAKTSLAELLAGVADQLMAVVFIELDWISTQPGVWMLSDEEQKDVPLGELAVVTVDKPDVVAVRLGMPSGSLQACQAGDIVITVSADPRLARVKDAVDRDDFPLVVNDGVTAAAGVAAATCPGLAALAGGGQHSLGLTTGGQVIAWGSNSYGQLGHGGAVNTGSRRPVTVTGLISVTALAAGLDFSLALREDGTVWAWGRNSDGQLGNRSAADKQTTPIQVSGLSGITAVAAGERFALALDGNGRVWAWGLNGYGQLGDGTRTSRRTPVRVPGLTGITAISAGRTHALALDGGGAVWAWGYNAFGQLGDESTEDRLTPVTVHLLPPSKAIAAGGLHSMALTEDGRVYAWGWGKYGQHTGGTVDRSFPIWTYVGNAIAIAAGYQHSVALKADGTVWTWGGNMSGQLGVGYTSQSGNAKRVERTGFTNIVGIEAGAYHTLAVATTGQGWSWGQNTSGQVGNELAAMGQTVPVVMRNP